MSKSSKKLIVRTNVKAGITVQWTGLDPRRDPCNYDPTCV
jgi:hypothetical protein